MAGEAKKFLDKWCAEHIAAVANPQKWDEGGKQAALCLIDAKAAGVDEKELEDAALGDLVSYMLDMLASQTDGRPNG